jgi:hypothetical protein
MSCAFRALALPADLGGDPGAEPDILGIAVQVLRRLLRMLREEESAAD